MSSGFETHLFLSVCLNFQTFVVILNGVGQLLASVPDRQPVYHLLALMIRGQGAGYARLLVIVALP